ncbi:hypothetical protein GCM10008018_71630 [Paenibacillus marchantiophytorum]|uniref:Uncharacterized protein n=1 Tax=Paenibacillus marchantiophytorum TaxID=1619310 RepID=A0ABQ1FIJ2_9BACL|nr:hypothetical protein GCM10008018_71630 [Paenibacillus marchantiophytorum]
MTVTIKNIIMDNEFAITIPLDADFLSFRNGYKINASSNPRKDRIVDFTVDSMGNKPSFAIGSRYSQWVDFNVNNNKKGIHTEIRKTNSAKSPITLIPCFVII